MGMGMGCCCVGGDCGPCCQDRGCISEEVEARITGVAGSGGPFTCSADCVDAFSDWVTLATGTSPYFDGQCLWESISVAPVACGVAATSVAAGWPFVTNASFTLGFAKKRLNCDGTTSNQSTCWLTAILTGDSTTSGQPDSGPFTVIFEKQIAGPYPTNCEGLHTLTYKCEVSASGAGVGCDWSGASVEINFVFNGQCDANMTFDPWTDDVNWAIESLCAEIDGDTDTLTNAASATTQQWTKVDLGVPGILEVDASLVWSEVHCAYRLTLTQSSTTTSCRLNPSTQTISGSIVSCDPFELLFEGFILGDDPEDGPCECGDPSDFDVRITQ